MEPSELNTLLGVGSNLGALGFIYWLVWRTTNFTLPNMAKTFEETLEKTQNAYDAAIDRHRVDFREVLTEQREFFSERIDSEQGKVEKFIAAFREFRGQ